MESALGLSYPTIKSRLANLKKRLTHDGGPPVEPKVESALQSNHLYRNVDQVLTALEKGEINHADSLKLIKKLK